MSQDCNNDFSTKCMIFYAIVQSSHTFLIISQDGDSVLLFAGVPDVHNLGYRRRVHPSACNLNIL